MNRLKELFEDIIDLSAKKKPEGVLVVEDNEIDSSQIVKCLTDDKYEVCIADTGKKAIGSIESR